jgi:hypothetical protein
MMMMMILHYKTLGSPWSTGLWNARYEQLCNACNKRAPYHSQMM